MTDCRVAASLDIFGAGTGAACLGDLEEEVHRREGEEKRERGMEGSFEQELLIDGLWLADITRYLGRVPELIPGRRRGRGRRQRAPSRPELQHKAPITMKDRMQARYSALWGVQEASHPGRRR